MFCLQKMCCLTLFRISWIKKALYKQLFMIYEYIKICSLIFLEPVVCFVWSVLSVFSKTFSNGRELSDKRRQAGKKTKTFLIGKFRQVLGLLRNLLDYVY